MAVKTRGIYTSTDMKGLVQDISVSAQCDSEEAMDNLGNVAAEDNFNVNTDIDFTVICGATAQPAVGATFTFTSATKYADYAKWNGAYRLRKIGAKLTNRTFATVTVTGKRYNTNGLP